jgi:hypothetical protein
MNYHAAQNLLKSVQLYILPFDWKKNPVPVKAPVPVTLMQAGLINAKPVAKRSRKARSPAKS